MGKKNKLTIQNKMIISYSTIIFLLIVTGIFSIYYVATVYNNGKAIYENDMRAVEYLKSINKNINEIDSKVFHCIVDVEWEHDKSCTDEIETLIAQNEQIIENYALLNINKEEQALYSEGKQDVLNYHEKVRYILSTEHTMNEKEMLQFYQDNLHPVVKKNNEAIDKAVNLAIKKASDSNETSRRIYKKSIIILCVILLFTSVTTVIISINMSNHILSRLKSIRMMAKRISEYNISEDIDNWGQDEFGQVIESLNESQFMIRELLEKILNESMIICDMGEEISLAVRKSERRVDQINVRILEYDKISLQAKKQVEDLLKERDLTKEELREVDAFHENLDNAKAILEQVRNELSNIASYLEQIGITCDYQNEISMSHKEQVNKFKIKESEM
ncbi:MAG: methyl-accepting chemotaxis protein [Lachnospiraceae bacterium]|nr:methyl-accepting chemotaxis protein [Lachnospiraceae bacterium]